MSPPTKTLYISFFLRVSGGSDKIHNVLMPFSVVDVRGPQVFQAVRRAKDVTVEYYMIGRLLLSATDALGCIQDASAAQACTIKRLTAVVSLFSATTYFGVALTQTGANGRGN